MNSIEEPATAVLPTYLVVDENYLAADPRVAAAGTAFFNRLSGSQDTVKATRLAVVTFADSVSLHAPMRPPESQVLPTVTTKETSSLHGPLLSYLPKLIDHDLDWFKDQATPILRPLLILVTGSRELLTQASTSLFDPQWRYRPNIFLVRSDSLAAPIEPGLPVAFSGTPETAAADLNQPFLAAAAAIVEVAESIMSGSPTTLRFPQSLAGWVATQGK